MKLVLAGEEIELLAEKAFFWPRQSILALSDIHFGKSESLQAAGIPLPSGAHHEDLLALRKLVQKTQARKVFILGDMIHQKNSWTEEIKTELKAFFNSFKNTQWTLILGNHEKGSKEFLSHLNLELKEGSIKDPPFVFTHGHEGEFFDSTEIAVQGHVHPVVVLREGPVKLRLPCFVLEEGQLTLPSFGILTGGHVIAKSRRHRIFAVAPEEVFEVASK